MTGNERRETKMDEEGVSASLSRESIRGWHGRQTLDPTRLILSLSTESDYEKWSHSMEIYS
jgi:hypothetical protein